MTALAVAMALTLSVQDPDSPLPTRRRATSEIAFHFERRRQWQVFWRKMQAILTEATSYERDPAAALLAISAQKATADAHVVRK